CSSVRASPVQPRSWPAEVASSDRHPVIAIPITFPRPKVTPAAASPRRSCRPPDRQTGRPVNSVIAAPIPKSASPLMAPLDATAAFPRVTRNGRIGTTAPTLKSRNDDAAASPADPPSSLGSIPSSSRASEQARQARDEDQLRVGGGSGHAHDQAEVRAETVVRPEDRCPERVPAHGAMPAFEPSQKTPSQAPRLGQHKLLEHLRMPALLGRHPRVRGLWLGDVIVLVCFLT